MATENVLAEVSSSQTNSFRFMNGWDMIAGTKQGRINQLLQKIPNMPVKISFEIPAFGMKIPVKLDLIIYSPRINVKDVSGRQVDVYFPISGKMTMGTQVFNFPADKSECIIATIELTQIEATLQDKQRKKQTKYDLILNLKSPDVIVDLKYKGVNAAELAAMIVALKKLLQGYVADHQQYKVASFYLNTDVANKYQAFIPQYAEFTFIKDDNNNDNSNVLVLMLTSSEEKGNIFFNEPILPVDHNFIFMVNNHLFLNELVYPEVVKNVKDHAKNKDQVDASMEIVPTDDLKELWIIKNNKDIPLNQDHDPWIATLNCNVDQTSKELLLYVDAKADVTFLKIHDDTWNKTWMKLQFSDNKLSFVKNHGHGGKSQDMEWWKWLIAVLSCGVALIITGIIYTIVGDRVPSLNGTFDSVATQFVEWPYQNQIAIKDVEIPGHVVFFVEPTFI